MLAAVAMFLPAMKMIPATLAVLSEVRRTYFRFPKPFHSVHEAVGFLEIEMHSLRSAVAEQNTTRLAGIAVEESATRMAAVAIRLLLDLVREGCDACDDQTCDKHPNQDQPGDFALMPEVWLDQRTIGGDTLGVDAVRKALAEMMRKSTL